MTRDGTRRLGYDAVCLTCEAVIDADERAFAEHGVGAWHADCDPPRNLSLYRRERDRGHRQRSRRRDFHLDDE